MTKNPSQVNYGLGKDAIMYDKDGSKALNRRRKALYFVPQAKQ